jgi:hypothetical protein
MALWKSSPPSARRTMDMRRRTGPRGRSDSAAQRLGSSSTMGSWSSTVQGLGAMAPVLVAAAVRPQAPAGAPAPDGPGGARPSPPPPL